jgi:hypothetical protein
MLSWGYVCWKKRFRTPAKAIILFAAGGEIVLIIYVFYTPTILVSFTEMTPQIVTTFMPGTIAAIVLPFRKEFLSPI